MGLVTREERRKKIVALLFEVYVWWFASFFCLLLSFLPLWWALGRFLLCFRSFVPSHKMTPSLGFSLI